ncbi:hypothetical protein [Mycolicibacterium monacense]|uniref:Uncharacterized protein n=3 Tax=Mycobacteriaceae TaxID=1762 RepID=A0AAD1IU98_MYCMB|nr:hypothetical protein [Mycolicibacterium monacense]MDA4102064.1 hypothetical protein [Mycolicibacterium monacense DSM 44395]OBB74896.1 hypothetical protein A6B34_14115 [Mycolicibacterium monacense]ORB20017.1 hypothetical protein BST34_13720 [Mycolicibacterium monacense DSM 44395]QHP86807.1 hypothetical protein EWR22_16415 [Mycolicibacterium monacense DSM 44395]BBZ60120.1 hypothetical protein MMON_14210 [Mycolicibacterium monacense]
MTRTSKRTVRIVFAATFVWIALLQYGLFAIDRMEPYPALVLPGFPAHCPGCLLETGEPATQEPELLVRFADGTTQRVPTETVLPPGPSVRLIAFTTAYKNDGFTSDPEAVAWLKSRIAERFPGEAVSGLDIVWRKATYKAADESAIEYEPSHTIHVNFGTTR